MTKTQKTEKKDWTLAYAITDTLRNQYDPEGKIFLMDFENKGKDKLLAKRSGIVSSLCYAPGLGLFDTGNYTRIQTSDGWWGDCSNIYDMSGLFRVLDGEGKLVNEALISVEQDYEKFRTYPNSSVHLGGEFEEVLKREKFQGGHINDLCFVPGTGLLGVTQKGFYVLVDSKGNFVNHRITSGWISLERRMEFVPQLGVVYSCVGYHTAGRTIECGINGNKHEVLRFDNPQTGETIFRWSHDGWRVPSDLAKKGFEHHTLYEGARDITYVPNSGVYVADDKGLRLCIKPNGEIVDERISDKRFKRLCYVPNRGLFGIVEAYTSLCQISKDKKFIFKDVMINPTEKKSCFDDISTLVAVPKK
jgi:hypothetical protein